MNKRQAKRGQFLISEPSMEDLNFKRSVLLITEHNNNESIAFILNQPTKLSVNDLIDDFPDFNTKIHIGGPVEKNTLHFIHSLGSKIDQSVAVSDNLYWSGNFETLKTLIRNGEVKESEVKFFIGYSGWSSGQLEYELQENAWIVINSDSSIALNNNDKRLWRKFIKQMDKDLAIWHNMPDDPELN